MSRETRDALGGEAFARYLLADYYATHSASEADCWLWRNEARAEWMVALQWWALAARQA